MDLDDEICLCFRVSRRKVLNYIRNTNPRVPSQISQCGGAGTGCGWCVPFLKQIFRQQVTDVPDVESLSVEEYAKLRGQYVREGHGVPPPGATPIPDAAPDENSTSS